MSQFKDRIEITHVDSAGDEVCELYTILITVIFQDTMSIVGLSNTREGWGTSSFGVNEDKSQNRVWFSGSFVLNRVYNVTGPSDPHLF